MAASAARRRRSRRTRLSRSAKTMLADPSTPLLRGGSFTIPAGVEGRTFVRSLTFDVPCRSEGRTAAHRERFCFIALLKSLLRTDAASFPATIVRGEAPDFIVLRKSGAAIAIEHTDAGEFEYQQHLAETDSTDEPVFAPSPGGDGWIGDGPKRAFAEALSVSFSRKAADSYWRNAPESSERWLLAYDQTNTGMFVSDAVALGFLRSAALEDRTTSRAFTRIYLVRNQDAVLEWHQKESVR